MASTKWGPVQFALNVSIVDDADVALKPRPVFPEVVPQPRKVSPPLRMQWCRKTLRYLCHSCEVVLQVVRFPIGTDVGKKISHVGATPESEHTLRLHQVDDQVASTSRSAENGTRTLCYRKATA